MSRYQRPSDGFWRDGAKMLGAGLASVYAAALAVHEGDFKETNAFMCHATLDLIVDENACRDLNRARLRLLGVVDNAGNSAAEWIAEQHIGEP